MGEGKKREETAHDKGTVARSEVSTVILLLSLWPFKKSLYISLALG